MLLGGNQSLQQPLGGATYLISQQLRYVPIPLPPFPPIETSYAYTRGNNIHHTEPLGKYLHDGHKATATSVQFRKKKEGRFFFWYGINCK